MKTLGLRGEPSTDKQPLVTIALPVYNGAATLSVAICSMLMQSFSDWELIILNDASTDDSLAVMRSFDDSRIRLVEGEGNIGLSARLNMAMDMARGEYFARMDQDDISFPQRLEKQLAYLQAHPDVDLLSANVVVFEGTDEVLGQWDVGSGTHEYICRHPWRGFYMAHPTWMGRLHWFRHYRYRTCADGAEDQDLLYRSFRQSHFACLSEPLLAYREARVLKKMYRARMVVLRSLGREALVSGFYVDAVKILSVQMAKIFADMLRHGLGLHTLRNALLPLDEKTRAEWYDILRKLKCVQAGERV
ncbi:MAG: glycosyltransferase family 2 protein [Mariprofundus sp.]|nr:glycosyltransferase family 2 protein [Mariprofundus sp.]